MSKSSSSEADTEPDLTAMLDMVMQLLMFFIICAGIIKSEKNEDVKLPRSDEAHLIDAVDRESYFINLVPFRLRGMRSDGLVVIRAARHIAKHRTASLSTPPYDAASDERAMETLHRLARHRVADSADLDMTSAVREILGQRPELAAAAERRRALSARRRLN